MFKINIWIRKYIKMSINFTHSYRYYCSNMQQVLHVDIKNIFIMTWYKVNENILSKNKDYFRWQALVFSFLFLFRINEQAMNRYRNSIEYNLFVIQFSCMHEYRLEFIQVCKLKSIILCMHCAVWYSELFFTCILRI